MDPAPLCRACQHLRQGTHRRPQKIAQGPGRIRIHAILPVNCNERRCPSKREYDHPTSRHGVCRTGSNEGTTLHSPHPAGSFDHTRPESLTPPNLLGTTCSAIPPTFILPTSPRNRRLVSPLCYADADHRFFVQSDETWTCSGPVCPLTPVSDSKSASHLRRSGQSTQNEHQEVDFCTPANDNADATDRRRRTLEGDLLLL
jgi:hypothetical protein